MSRPYSDENKEKKGRNAMILVGGKNTRSKKYDDSCCRKNVLHYIYKRKFVYLQTKQEWSVVPFQGTKIKFVPYNHTCTLLYHTYVFTIHCFNVHFTFTEMERVNGSSDIIPYLLYEVIV